MLKLIGIFLLGAAVTYFFMRGHHDRGMNLKIQVKNIDQDIVREGDNIIISESYRHRLLTDDFDK